MTASIAVIGGTGLSELPDLNILKSEDVDTPYGKPSACLRFGELYDKTLVFLPRHGDDHHIAPHRVNYRANIWALREAGVKDILAVAAVGAIRSDMHPGRIAFPDQILDYTWGREHTFSDGDSAHVQHIEFGQPYDEALRQRCIELAGAAQLDAVNEGVYAATQGPRLETEAEIRRLQRDGADMVGMTGMPEAALARELGLAYVCCAVMVNWAAGLADGGIHDQIDASVAEGMQRVAKLLQFLCAETTE